ncbi:MAG TPA: hypothetical protein VM327_03125 [Candidatus Thermoplasmatota archaeon]|nr:hypothetical protein [Candidatus Thermoplasmatota archaeon]
MSGPHGSLEASQRRLPLAVLLLLIGLAGFIVGAAYAWGDHPLFGFTIGSIGTIALVIGSILARNAMVGRFLEGGDE